MRHVLLGSTLTALVFAAGCNSTKWGLFQRGGQPVTAQTYSAEQLVYYLNGNADRVTSVHCNQLTIQCARRLLKIDLDGKMVCEKPRNFRMRATLGGTDQLDMGSNNQEFWYWVAKGDNVQFHCPYQALEQGRVPQLPIPFQPDWIMEALGIARYAPATSDHYQVVPRQGTVELVERARSPQGRPIRKVTVFRSTPAPKGSPQVTAHLLVDDATGKEICSAHTTEVQLVRARDPQGNGEVMVILPRKVELRWPAQSVKLTLILDEVTVNQPVARPDLAFTRTPMANIRSYDLAQGRIDSPTSIQRVLGSSYR